MKNLTKRFLSLFGICPSSWKGSYFRATVSAGELTVGDSAFVAAVPPQLKALWKKMREIGYQGKADFKSICTFAKDHGYDLIYNGWHRQWILRSPTTNCIL